MTVVIAGRTFTLNDEGRWEGPGPMRDILNSFSRMVMHTYQVADGDPVVRIFNYIVETFKPESSTFIEPAYPDDYEELNY